MSKQNIPASPVYGYLRQWFDFAFENQGKVSGNHTAVYCWYIEQNNRLGWAKEFGAPRDQTMAAAGISSYNTYKKCFDDLEHWGFIKVIKRSKNQYMANIIALSKFDKAKYKALDKAMTQHYTKQSTGTSHGTVALNIPIDIETYIPIVVVEYAHILSFFLESKLKRQYTEKYKMAPGEIEKKFEEFYNVKFDTGDLNNKTEGDILNFFSNWLPKNLIKDTEFSQKNNFKNGSANNKSNAQSIIDNAKDFLREKYGDS